MVRDPVLSFPAGRSSARRAEAGGPGQPRRRHRRRGHLRHISRRTTLCSCRVTSVSAGAPTRYAIRTGPSVSTLISQPVGYLGIRCLTAILSSNWMRKLVQQRAGCSVSFLTALQMLANPAMGTHRCHRCHRCHRAPPKHGRPRSRISQSRRSAAIPSLRAWCNWGHGSG
jgi:hypothetical protein